jgi:hypothetical protein
MLGTKEICALLLAGGLGAGSVVTVQQVRAPATDARAAKPRPKPAQVAHRATPAPSGAALKECPAVGAPVLAPILTPPQDMPMGLQSLGSLPVAGAFGGGGGSVGSGGGGTGNTSLVPDPSPVPGVPDPATWVMLIAGFGFVGLALRRQPNPADTHES